MRDPKLQISPRLRLSLLLLVIGIFALQLTHLARLYSANWDEAHHLYDGYHVWTEHDYRLNAEVPPLVKLVAALPLLPMHLQRPPALGDSQSQSAFLEGRAFVFGNGGDRVLLPARAMCMLFTLGLALLVFGVSRHLFGDLAGFASLVLLTFDPNLLAHGTLISTDVASALFLFGSVAALLLYLERPGPLRLLATGLLAGFALVAKFTGIVVLPLLLTLCVGEGLLRRDARSTGRLLLRCALMLGIAWMVVWAFYGFRYAPAPSGRSLSPALAPYIASLPNHAGAAELTFFARFHLLPEAYLWGLANTRHTEWQYTSYFFGKVYRHGPWQYFPAAFLIKSTLPLLILLVLCPFVWGMKLGNHGRVLLFLLLPVAAYFALITTSHFDIGARHLMPVYPFLYVLAGAAVAFAWQRGRVWAAVAGLLLCWQVVTTERVAPSEMAYGNEAWGGPLAVRRYLSDANVDWGQQLKTAQRYLADNHITNCWFAYFPDGAVEAQDYGVHCKRLPTPSGLWWFDLPMQVPPAIDGTVLISESDLDGVESGDGPLNPYAAFQQQRPVAVLQDGLYVYQGHFDVPLAAAWGDVRASQKFAQAGHLPEALAKAEDAVQLAPKQARTQCNLAQLLAQGGRRDEAHKHFLEAQHWLLANRPELEREEFEQPIAEGLRQTSDAH